MMEKAKETKEPKAATNFVCQKCGWSTPTATFDLLQQPGPGRCTQIYTSSSGFPVQAGSTTHHISGPCNGTIIRQ